MAPILEVESLEAFYGRTKALHGVTFSMEPGGITTVLGANGAGKTTTLRAISAMVRTTGAIRFAGDRIDGKATEQIVGLGIAHVPQGRGTFVDLTVEENLRVGMYGRRDKRGAGDDFERVYGYFPRLEERRRQMAGTLSGGEQQMLAVARALMSSPRILLVDEPSVGLAPILVNRVIGKIRELKERYHLTVLMAEQNFNQATKIADRGYIIVHGRIEFEGRSTAELRENELVKKYYLGV
jgi:branched-chain amino acid transport system ATP-binding protein